MVCITVLFCYNSSVNTFFTSKVSSTAIDIAVYLHGAMKLSKHERAQLWIIISWPLGYHYVSLHSNWQTFATCLVDIYYMKWIAILNTLCNKSMLVYEISGINQVVHSKFLMKYAPLLYFCQFGCTDSAGWLTFVNKPFTLW